MFKVRRRRAAAVAISALIMLTLLALATGLLGTLLCNAERDNLYTFQTCVWAWQGRAIPVISGIALVLVGAALAVWRKGTRARS